MRTCVLVFASSLLLAGCSSFGSTPAANMATSMSAAELARWQQQVIAAETAFAQTMAARDHAAFASFLADDAVFVSGKQILRGKTAVAAGWQSFFVGESAPFSWQPQTVEVQASGQLALSSGPVRDPQGRIIAEFNSIWRQEAPGIWRIVFDKGNAVCPPAQP